MCWSLMTCCTPHVTCFHALVRWDFLGPFLQMDSMPAFQ